MSKTPWNKGLRKPRPDWQVRIDDDGKLYQRYLNKRTNARAEGLECELTFQEYCYLVENAGLKSSQLGFTGEGYVLARYNDSGNYKVDNCRFIKHLDNVKERVLTEKSRANSRKNAIRMNQIIHGNK